MLSWDVISSFDTSLENRVRDILRCVDEKPWRQIETVPPWMDVLVMNILQKKELDCTSPDDSHYSVCMKCLRALGKARNVFPDSFIRRDIRRKGNYPCTGGGLSDIWEGDMGGRPVCLKVLRTFSLSNYEKEALLKNLCREALVWKQLHHKNILPFLGVNYEYFKPRCCLISPWMKNGNIISYLQANKHHDRMKCIVEISDAVDFLHGLDPRIVHGDIRGENILVDDELRCCLADFGSNISVATQAPSESSMSHSSLRWLAPELQVYDPESYDQECLPGRDIYAFGCTAIEIFTLKPPFSHIRPAAILYRIYSGERHPRPSLGVFPSDQLWNLVEQCMSLQPKERPTASDVKHILAHM
ncbi:kinase-like protein [Armillaria gallica]|uniref:Kinase-like protein n=1 Tax=Armillaria gallica TaxID=47427 RepID=A0A2H3DJ84_ARMGA|nr:kinase-like protein [Armillaria gallica]